MQKLLNFRELPAEEMLSISREFQQTMCRRRSVRSFSKRPIDREVIENAIKTAGSAPSGANKQPWHFAVVESQETKRLIGRGWPSLGAGLGILWRLGGLLEGGSAEPCWAVLPT